MTEKAPKESIVIREANKTELKRFKFPESAMANIKFFVAVHEGKVVGDCCVEILTGKKEGLVNVEIYEKEFRRMGIGHRLLGKAHAFLHSKGIKASRTKAKRGRRGFYEKAGYKKIGAIEAGSIILAHKMVRVSAAKKRRRRK